MFVQPLESRRFFAVNLDTGFGANGYASLAGVAALPPHPGPAGGMSIDVMPDDRIVGAAQFEGPEGQGIVGVVRWLANGTLDTSFSGDGAVTTDLVGGSDGANSDAIAQDVYVAADGKVLVTGKTRTFLRSGVAKHTALFVLRFNADGSPDATFGGGDGVLAVDLVGDVSDLQATVLSDGRIAIVGILSVETTAPPNPRQDPLFARFNSDGSPDTSFSPTGLLSYETTGQWRFTDDIEIGPDGESYVLATRDGDDVITRFTPDGERDATFVADPDLPLGWFSFTWNGSVGARRLHVQDDGKLIVTGVIGPGATGRAAVARLLDDGALDPTYGDGGYVVGRPGEFLDTFLVGHNEVIGYVRRFSSNVFFRFDANGGAVDGWESGVEVDAPIADQDAAAQSSGKLVLAGRIFPAGTPPHEFGLARVTDSPEPFGSGSNPTTLIVPGATEGDDVIAITVGVATIDVVANGTLESFARDAYERLLIAGMGGDDQITVTGNIAMMVADGGAGDDTITASGGSDIITGGAGNDLLIGDPGGPDLLTYQQSEDTLVGEAGDDVLHGGDAGDELLGGIGQDTLFGEGGNDGLRGEDGADLLHGGAGHDRITGEAGRDRLYGADGQDILQGGPGDDRLLGNAHVDKLYGGSGNDTAEGGDAADFLWGHDGDDSLDGGGGTDRIFAHDGADTLRGGQGNDYLDGGAGADLLSGHAGNDRFIASDGAADTVSGGAGDDEADVDELLDVSDSVEVPA